MLQLLRAVSSYVVVVKFEPGDGSVVNDHPDTGDELDKSNERVNGEWNSGNNQSKENILEKKEALADKIPTGNVKKNERENKSVSNETAQLKVIDEIVQIKASLINKNDGGPGADVATDSVTQAKVSSSAATNFANEKILAPTGKMSTSPKNVNFLKQSESGQQVLKKKLVGSATEKLPEVSGEHHYFLAAYSVSLSSKLCIEKQPLPLHLDRG